MQLVLLIIIAKIKDIARKAGVNVSTVSRALNDSPFVKSNTKERILELAEEMD